MPMGRFSDRFLPRQALANSRNVPATNLLRRVGVETSFQFLHELGLHDLEAPAESLRRFAWRLDRCRRVWKISFAPMARSRTMAVSPISFTPGSKAGGPLRVISTDTARLITSMLADPQARLPSFPRYGPLEYPFAVAVKTGTSQGYRDAWTLAYSNKVIVGVWMGRADAGTMNRLGGAASSARLAHAVLAHIHGAKVGDITPDAFHRRRDERLSNFAPPAAAATMAAAAKCSRNGSGPTKRKRSHPPLLAGNLFLSRWKRLRLSKSRSPSRRPNIIAASGAILSSRWRPIRLR